MSGISKLPSTLAFLNKPDEVLNTEFSKLPNAPFNNGSEPFQNPEFSEACLPENKYKNRYSNIVPNNNTRVVLPATTEHVNTYINANHCLNNSAIISQGPLDDGDQGYFNHQRDFYHMLYTQDSSAIAMVTGYVEKYVIKCSKYLPMEGVPRTLGEYTVSVESNESVQNPFLKQAGVYISKITITNNAAKSDQPKTKTVTHYHLPTWADNKGTNAKVLSVLARTMLKEKNPVLHCSAGIGRSGTLATVMKVYAEIKQGNIHDNLVIDTVTALRNERRGCVQTEDQYRTIHETVKLMIEEDIANDKTAPSDLNSNTSKKADPCIIIELAEPTVYPLFIRGSGGNLSWDKGIPLQKLEEKKYGVSLQNVSGKVEYKVLVEDKEWESGNNHSIEVGQTQKITPAVRIPKPAIVVDGNVVGKKISIRGTGPGMSWDKAIELKQVDNKLVFETNEEPTDFEFKLLVNGEWEQGNNRRYIKGKPLNITI